MKKILFHSGAGIGDIILATPAITALAKAGHQVDWLIDTDTAYDVVALYKDWFLLRKVSSRNADFDAESYDYYFMAPGVLRPVKVTNPKTTVLFASFPEAMREYTSYADTFLAYAKIIDPAIDVHCETYCGASTRVFPDVSKETVVLFPGCGKFYPMKRWDKYDELAARFTNVVVIGTAEDMDLSHSYFCRRFIAKFFAHPLHYDGKTNDLARALSPKYNRPFRFAKHVKSYIGQLSLPDVAALIKQAGLFIGNDGGMTHVAAAMGIPTVAIFGPTSVEMLRVRRENILYLTKGLDCQPCQFGGKYPQAWRHGYVGCPIGMKCMTDLSVDEVYQAAIKFRNQRSS